MSILYSSCDIKMILLQKFTLDSFTDCLYDYFLFRAKHLSSVRLSLYALFKSFY